MDNFNITGWFRNLYLQRLHESEESKLDIAKKEAQRISKEEGVTQHVNKVGKEDYKVENWYDANTTVASYENGRVLNENLSKEEVKRKDEIYQDLKKDKREFIMRYGKDAEKVMMGRAIEMAKKEIND